MIVHVLMFVASLSTAEFYGEEIPDKDHHALTDPIAQHYKMKAVKIFEERHFNTPEGCHAVAHTINREKAAQAKDGDPGLYAACVPYDADDEL